MKYYKYIKYLLFFLICIILFGYNDADIVWNYGVAHALRIGEIPYKDFNSITTPLYPMIMSLGLYISDTYLTYIIEQSLLCTLFMFLLEKYLKDNYIIMIPLICFPIFMFIFPNYNFLIMIIIILLLLFEEDKKTDWQIGLLLGLMFITKHTIGIVFIFFSIISTLNIKRGFKRFIYSLIPIIVFFIYLIITKSLSSFINLSILGLFDFGKNNKSVLVVLALLSLLCFIYTIYSFFKYKNDYKNYYLLAAISLIIPMIDFMHTTYYLIVVIVVLLSRSNIKYQNKQLLIPIISITITIFILNVMNHYDYYKNVEFNNLERFKLYLLDKEGNEYVNTVLKKYKKYKNSHMFSMESMFFDIESGKKITYFGVPLYGNFGYDGINNMKKKISEMHNHYIFICDNDNPQFPNEINDYIRKNGTLVEKFENYEIYKIK